MVIDMANQRILKYEDHNDIGKPGLSYDTVHHLSLGWINYKHFGQWVGNRSLDCKCDLSYDADNISDATLFVYVPTREYKQLSRSNLSCSMMWSTENVDDNAIILNGDSWCNYKIILCDIKKRK